MRNFWIDLASVDLESFNITEKDGLTLVAPTKFKHSWADHELHLRSLLLDKDGYVVSAGFPKFVNYGEKPAHDTSLLEAVDNHGSVVFSSKEDGSLIIASQVNGKPHFRTRGSHDLGSFSEPVMALVRNKYPAILWLLEKMPPRYSILFEYTAPSNQIVLKYPEPALHYLGIVDLQWLHVLPHNMIGAQDLCSPKLHEFPPPVAFHDLPSNVHEIIREVRSWKGKEGVVARILLPEPDPITGPVRMVKIKADMYLKLHTLKYCLGGRAGKLAFLLDITSMDEAPEKLASLGIDYEGQQFLMPELTEYIEKYLFARVVFEKFIAVCEALKALTSYTSDPREGRKAFVADIQESIRATGLPEHYFAPAMAWYSGKSDDAWLQILAADVLEESAVAVRTWLRDRQAILDDMLHQPVSDDNE